MANSMKIPLVIIITLAMLTVKLSGVNAPERKPRRALPGKGISANQNGKLSVYDVSLNISLALRPGTDIAACRKEFEQMVADLRTRLRGKRQPEEIVQTFNDYLFKEKMFRYESKVHFLGEVLDQKCGSCVGLTTLYIALAQRLGVPCVAVNLPRHVFARYRDTTSCINIEMGANGATVADNWFIQEYSLDAAIIKKGVYFRELTENELAAIVLSNCGNALRETGARPEAKTYLDQALSLYPRSVDSLYSRGITLIEMGHIDEGIKDCDAALALDPGCAFAYVNRGMGYSLKGQHSRALADINKAIKLDPRQSGFYTNRGSVHSAMGLDDKALKDYNKAISLDPMAAEAYCNRANLFRDQGALREAFQDYDRALRISPGFAIAHFNRGKTYLGIGKMDAAAAAFSKAIKHDPGLGEAYYNRGVILAMTGKQAAALKDCNAAIVLLPKVGGAYLVRAVVHAMAKDKKSAFADLRKALVLDPNLRPVSERNEAFREWWNDPEYKRIFQ